MLIEALRWLFGQELADPGSQEKAGQAKKLLANDRTEL
jgi:hypothetical protein